MNSVSTRSFSRRWSTWLLCSAAAALMAGPSVSQAGDRWDRDRDDRRSDDRRSSERRGAEVRVDINVSRDRFSRHDDRDHDRRDDWGARSQRVWVEPVYRTTHDRVWIEPVYREVRDRVWHDAVYEDRCERVWVDARYEYREIVRIDICGNRIVARERVCVSPGHWEERRVRVCVREGYYEDVCRRVLVCDGHWKTIERRECVSEGYWTSSPVRERYAGGDRGGRYRD